MLRESWESPRASIGVVALHRAVQKATPGARGAGVDATARSFWRASRVTFTPFSPSEVESVVFWIVTSIAPNKALAVGNFVNALHALGANPDELLSGRQKHGPLRGIGKPGIGARYYALGVALPGSRVPMAE